MTRVRMARIVGAALVAAAIAAAAIVVEMRDEDRPAEAPQATAAGADPLGVELARCRSIGISAVENRACQTAWQARRDRFFGRLGERR